MQATVDEAAPEQPAGIAPEAGERRIAVIINREAGTARTWDDEVLAETVRAALDPVGAVQDVVLTTGADLVAHMERAFGDPAIDLVVVGGGDGTASTAASHAIRHDKPVCVLPLGTFNLFARLNGFPPTLEGALGMLKEAQLARIDAGRFGERYFLHHVSIGAHPRVIRLREGFSYSGRWSKKLAGVRAWIQAILDPPKVRLTIRADTQELRGTFSNVMVTVNELAETPSVAPVAADPQGGRLALYATRTTTPRNFVLFTLFALAGRWRSNPLAAFARAHRVAIRTKLTRIALSIDGERVEVQAPLDIELVPEALTVLRVPMPKPA